jgi:dipeptidase E
MPRLLLVSSNLAAPSLAAAAGRLISGCRALALITTAEARLKERSREIILAHSILTSLGASGLEFFDLDARPAADLAKFDSIYIAGGNPFYLLKRAYETDADSVLAELTAKGIPIIAAGEGAAVLGRTLRALRVFDATAPDFGLKDPEALSLVPFAVLPHANRWRARFADYPGRLAAAEKSCRCEIVELLDGEGLQITDEATTPIASEPNAGFVVSDLGADRQPLATRMHRPEAARRSAEVGLLDGTSDRERASASDA